jgi:nitroreductase
MLAEAARAAGSAPSVHNTQPWRWRVVGNRLDLYAARERQLGVTDPVGRLLHLSCGAALHHARVALAAEGWRPEVHRLPDPADTDLLARLTLAAQVPVVPAAVRLFQALLVRHTDRRPVSEAAVDPAVVDQLTRVIAGEGARLHLLDRDQLLLLAAAADEAQRAEVADPDWRAELAYWAGGERSGGVGVPANAIPAQAPQTTVPGRDFGRPGSLPVTSGHDRAAVYAILYGDEDTALGWLRGGEALSAGWLAATAAGVSVLPLSAVVEVPRTRSTLAGLLAYLGHPYLVLRLGVADPDHAGSPRPPRLGADQVIEILEPDGSGSA